MTMGLSLSCPLANYIDLESGLESVMVKSINSGGHEIKSQDSEPKIMKFAEPRKMASEQSVTFKKREPKTISEIPTLSLNEPNDVPKMEEEHSPRSLELPGFGPSNPEHNAAIKLQKVYKSFRTRRKLADCAVLVEQSWWKILDFAELKHSSISFFDGDKHETAISRWSRARTRAAKVGKGLSKSDKGQKLQLQHWLEAIDPRHRYGHNLHFYYKEWLNSQSREPFFYWLDIGEGKEKDLVKCSRSKLQQQCIKYLGPMERKAYEISLEDGKFFYKQTGEPLHTTDDSKDVKWIFVLSTSKIIYAGKKKKGSFQHSSFLAGGAALAAGRLVVEHGTLKAVWPHSGHYRPTEESFKDFLSFLKDNNVDLSDVKSTPMDEEETSVRRQKSMLLRSSSSEEDLTRKVDGSGVDARKLQQEGTDVVAKNSPAVDLDSSKSRRIRNFSRSLSNLEIPKRIESFETLGNENADPESPVDCYTTAKAAFASRNEDNQVKTVPPEPTLQRTFSPRESKSLQMGKQLSCKWSTGAGPRIGFVRDHPAELQVRALEQVNLSPRSASLARSLSQLKEHPTVHHCRPNSSLWRETSAYHEVAS